MAEQQYVFRGVKGNKPAKKRQTLAKGLETTISPGPVKPLPSARP